MTLADFRRIPRKPRIVKWDGLWCVLGLPTMSGCVSFKSFDDLKRWWKC